MNRHPAPVASPQGTPLTDRTVGELVAERPGRSRIFQTHRIDFCCQGGKTLRVACEGRGVSLESVVEQLEAEAASPLPTGENPAQLPPEALADYIVGRHHDYLRGELPRLHAMSGRVAQVHGPHTPSLVEVFEIFCGLEAELSSHMMKEEMVLFPAVKALASGEAVPMPLDGPISVMLHEHEDAGAALARLRELTHGFTPPADACNTYRALFAGLADLENDLQRHIHLENSVLFPAAQAMAGAVH
ncbi:MAG: iron-sulfur cluster repair di-iron protein [Bdellovibrionaceae bacterium]|nr:iron-sulfur cluster repair di-iron protein [Pseudobdellovibrionaceae bacterium]